MIRLKKAIAGSALGVGMVAAGLGAVATPAWAGEAESAPAPAAATSDVKPAAECNVHAWAPTQTKSSVTGRSGAQCYRTVHSVQSNLWISKSWLPDDHIAAKSIKRSGYVDAKHRCHGNLPYYTAGSVTYTNSDGWRVVSTHQSPSRTLC